MIRIHHLNNSRSQRVLWLLEELGLTYDIVRYQRDRKTLLAPEALKAIHPLGKAPVLEDGGRVFAETGAIIQYLVETYGPQLAPERGADLYGRYLYWLHYAEGSLMPPLLLDLVIQRLGLLGLPARGYVASQLKLQFDFIEGQLGASTWFAGEAFTAADIMMSFPLEAAVGRSGLTKSRPLTWAFLERIHARPAYKRALQKAGDYTMVK